MSDILESFMGDILVAGIDPGTKSLGVAVYRPKTQGVSTWSIRPPKDFELREKIAYIGNNLWEPYDIEENGPGLKSFSVDHFVIEESTYRGVAENSFKRLLGVVEFILPVHIPLTRVNPATIKAFCGGKPKRRCGKEWLPAEGMEKIDVARYVLAQFGNLRARDWIDTLIDEERWDETDAIAIAMWGANEIAKRNSEGSTESGPVKPSRRRIKKRIKD